MTLRFKYVHHTRYVVQTYSIDRQLFASWVKHDDLYVLGVKYGGVIYAIAFDSDNDTADWPGTVVHAPRGVSRPLNVVPGSHGAVVPGPPVRGGESQGNDCIQGVDEDCGVAQTPHGNTCIQGVDEGC